MTPEQRARLLSHLIRWSGSRYNPVWSGDLLSVELETLGHLCRSSEHGWLITERGKRALVQPEPFAVRP